MCLAEIIQLTVKISLRHVNENFSSNFQRKLNLEKKSFVERLDFSCLKLSLRAYTGHAKTLACQC